MDPIPKAEVGSIPITNEAPLTPKQGCLPNRSLKPHERKLFDAVAESTENLSIHNRTDPQAETKSVIMSKQDSSGKIKQVAQKQKPQAQAGNGATKGLAPLNRPAAMVTTNAKLEDYPSTCIPAISEESRGQTAKKGFKNGMVTPNSQTQSRPSGRASTIALTNPSQSDAVQIAKRSSPSSQQRLNVAKGTRPHAVHGNKNHMNSHATGYQPPVTQARGTNSQGNPNVSVGNPNSFNRPPPRHRMIFDPNRHPGLPPPSKDLAVPLREQCQYLQRIADFHNPNIAITYAELNEREALRLNLQELCRDVVSYIAMEENPTFSRESVSLQCFGSLRSGFATRASDMDLALVCPSVDLDPSSDNSMVPRLLEQVFLHKGYGARLLTRTRVPILRLCEKPSEELMEALLIERLKWDRAQASARSASDQKQSVAAVQADLGAKPKCATSPKDLEDERMREKSADNGMKHSPSSSSHAISGKLASSVPSVEESPPIERTDEELVRLFSLAIKEGWYSQGERELITKFSRCYRQAKGDVDNEELMKARSDLKALPDILSRYREPNDSRLEFPKNGVGIQCDINFSNPLALHNTQLLRCYTICNPRIRDMVIFIKAWAKKRDINSPYKGTLSSYGYVLMVLHYAINVATPPLAPNLQLQLSPVRGGSANTERFCNGHNVQFWRDEKQIILASERGQLTYSNESLGSLLRGFFHYYAEQGHVNHAPQGGFFWTRAVLSLRTEGGILNKEAKGWIGARTEVKEGSGPNEKPVEVRQRYLLAIEDPFETNHNVARPVNHNGICAIRDEFRRAHRIIKNAGVIDNVSLDLFEECKHSELEREQRLFGPNPGLALLKPKITGPKAAGRSQRPGGEEIARVER